MRGRAEKVAREVAPLSQGYDDALSPEEMRHALHELKVHQIELQMQNEELRRAEAELLHARARYFDLYDRAPVGYCTLSEKGLILEANLTAATLFSTARGALVNQPFTQFVLSEDQDHYYRHRKKLFETGDSQTCELRMVGKDGTVFWARLAATVAPDDDGAMVHRVVISDITQGKETANKLHTSEERLRLALQAAELATWDWHIPTGEMTWNEEYYRMLGYEVGADKPSYEAAMGRVHADDRKSVEAAFQAAMNEGHESRFEFRTCWPDGTVRWRSAICEFVFDATGHAVRSYGVLRDITEKKEAELRILNLNDALQTHVIAVDAVNKELEAFSYSVSHDLRTPLRFVNKIAYKLGHEHGTVLTDATAQQVNMILQATDEMAQLIEKLLLFSQVNRGPMARHDVDLRRLFQETAIVLRDAQENGNLEIAIQDLTPCQGDRTLLKEVVVNLLSNAIKFTRRREKARITVGCREIEGRTVYFVEDNGAGFDMDNVDSLFVPFQRLHRTAEFEGTGIGLALAKRIIERHGGRIWASGEIDKGATFYFTVGKANDALVNGSKSG